MVPNSIQEKNEKVERIYWKGTFGRQNTKEFLQEIILIFVNFEVLNNGEIVKTNDKLLPSFRLVSTLFFGFLEDN